MKMRIAVLCALFALGMGTQTLAATEPARISGSGAFLAVSVLDLDASARWYSEKLGLKVVMRVPKTDGTAVTVLEGEGLIVELIQRDGAISLSSIAPGKDRTLVQGLFKAGVIVEDFDKTVAMLRARAVEIAFGPFPKKPDQRANVCIRDNAGNLIQFFGP